MTQDVARQGLLSRLAQAYFARERQRLGIGAEERAATEAASSDLVRRAQAARTMQQVEMAPAEAESEADLRAAQAEAQRATAGYTAQRPDIEAGRISWQQEKDARDQQQAMELARLRGEITASNRVPQTIVIRTTDAEGQPVTRIVPKTAGSEYSAPPTTAERNAASGVTTGQMNLKIARQRATPILQDLASRAVDLNRGGEGGLVQRAGGTARRIAGGMGMDSAADLYTTGIRGFVPLFARSVGHVGVLTELDVKRTEDLFPRIGDSEATTLEKLTRLQRIMTGTEPIPFQWERPEYDEGGITVPGTGVSATPPVPTSGGGTFRVLGVRP